MNILNLDLWLVFLILSVYDIKYKKIPIDYLILFAVISVFRWGMNAFLYKTELMGGLVAVLPGLLLYILANISGKNVGKGDGLVLIFAEIGRAGTEFVISLLFMFGMLMGISLVLVTIDSIKKRRGRMIPFVPFIFLGTLFAEVVI